MRLKLLAAASALLALSACFGGGAPSQLLTLTAGRARARPRSRAPPARARRSPSSCRPCRRRCARPASRSMSATPSSSISRTRPGWRIPAPLFGRLLGETIAARTGRVVLDPSQYSHDPGTRLTGQLQRFGLDPNAMEVVVVYDAAIARGNDGGVATNRFEARVPVAAATRRSGRPGAQPGRQPGRRPGRRLGRPASAASAARRRWSRRAEPVASSAAVGR